MSILDVVETGHEHVSDLRHELGRVREALDRTDAVLGVTDEALERAGVAIDTSRRVAPIVLTVVGLAALGAIAFAVVRSRRRRAESGS